MSWKRSAFLLAAAVLPAACGDGFYTGPTIMSIPGHYVASNARGEFFYTADQKTWNLAQEGSVVDLTISSNGTTTGRIFVPAENENAESYEASLAGTWMTRGDTVFFTQKEPTVVSTMAFIFDGQKLRAERNYIDGYVKLTLVR